MKLGNKINFVTIICFLFFYSFLFAEEKILTTPLINLEELKPSFEEIEESSSNENSGNAILSKKKLNKKDTLSHAKFIGLDKITAKTSEIIVNLGESKKFGPLEIKVLKCGSSNIENKINNVAYLQVKDLSENDNEKVFIFNGWTFASEPSLTPFDHAIYDLQLVNCYNA